MVTIDEGLSVQNAKYYSHTTQTRHEIRTLHSNDLYQIFIYVKNKDTEFGDRSHTVSGMLLCAATDETAQPNNSFQTRDSKISVRMLDMSQHSEENNLVRQF